MARNLVRVLTERINSYVQFYGRCFDDSYGINSLASLVGLSDLLRAREKLTNIFPSGRTIDREQALSAILWHFILSKITKRE